MPAYFYRKVADFQGRVFPEASAQRADPARGRRLRLAARPFQEPLERCTKVIFAGFCLASVSEASRLFADASSDPQHDGRRWKCPASKPGGIELDLDLFESNRRGCVAMTRAGAIEDRGRPGDEVLPDFSLVQIGADHKERKNRPVVGVLWHAGVATVDDPSERSSAEASQHQIPGRFNYGVASYINAAAQAVKRKERDGPATLNLSNTRSEARVKTRFPSRRTAEIPNPSMWLWDQDSCYP
jgi:hypothetical protein